MQQKENNFAYIDGANLHKGVDSLNWKLDYSRFRVWLTEKYGIKSAFIFMGLIPRYKELYTYLQVRDDALVLFGFETKRQYNFFLLLLTVSGVGPKTAFTVISSLKTEEIVSAVTSNEVDTLTKVPGLGRKTAMKIILELSSKFKADFDMKNMVLSKQK